MFNIIIEDNFRKFVPSYIVGIIEASVVNKPTSSLLMDEIRLCVNNIRKQYNVDTIKERSGIKATRLAYKNMGKDPSRYRPSCEQLCRRVLQGKELYFIDTLVDIGNLVSMESGYSVAVVDSDKISEELICLGIGKEQEPYEAIGRGVLNIANMPVWRDNLGGFATPTSDSVRTMCSAETKNILIIINGYDGNVDALSHAVDRTIYLLSQYAESDNVKKRILR